MTIQYNITIRVGFRRYRYNIKIYDEKTISTFKNPRYCQATYKGMIQGGAKAKLLDSNTLVQEYLDMKEKQIEEIIIRDLDSAKAKNSLQFNINFKKEEIDEKGIS